MTIILTARLGSAARSLSPERRCYETTSVCIFSVKTFERETLATCMGEGAGYSKTGWKSRLFHTRFVPRVEAYPHLSACLAARRYLNALYLMWRARLPLYDLRSAALCFKKFHIAERSLEGSDCGMIFAKHSRGNSRQRKSKLSKQNIKSKCPSVSNTHSQSAGRTDIFCHKLPLLQPYTGTILQLH